MRSIIGIDNHTYCQLVRIWIAAATRSSTNQEASVGVLYSPFIFRTGPTSVTLPPMVSRAGMAGTAFWVGWQMGPTVARHHEQQVEGIAQLMEWFGVPSEFLRGPNRVFSSPSQDKMLTPGEINRLEEGGVDVHELKGNKRTGQIDLYKRPNGDIVIKPKGGGKMQGEETGYNINDF